MNRTLKNILIKEFLVLYIGGVMGNYMGNSIGYFSGIIEASEHKLNSKMYSAWIKYAEENKEGLTSLMNLIPARGVVEAKKISVPVEDIVKTD